jgi:cyclic-di-GMP phosphodiesterase TipF (flagellum assembly factor)
MIMGLLRGESLRRPSPVPARDRLMRFSAAFIAACMVVIAAALAATAYLLLGFTLIEAAATALTLLALLAGYNAFSGRVHERADVGHQIADLAQGTADLARQVKDLGRRLNAVEAIAANAGADARAAAAPLAEEIEVLGTLVNQLAQSVAAHEVALVEAVRAPSVPAPLGSAAARGDAAADMMGPEAAVGVAAPEPPGRPTARRLAGMREEAVVDLVRSALAANRLDLHLQPIVTLPQRKVRYYEALTRLRTEDGEALAPADYLGVAESGGLMPTLDNAVLLRCVQVVRRLSAKSREVGLFCNIAGSTLADAAVFPQLADFLAANRAFASTLVLEFAQAAVRALGQIEQESLAQLASLGFRFSLDQVGDLALEPKDLAERGFRFVKIPAALLLAHAGAAATDIHPADLSNLLGRYGIDLIAEKIESEGTVVDLLDYDIRFGQGFLFSAPRPVRADVFQAAPDRPQAQAPEQPLPAPADPPPMQGARAASRRQDEPAGAPKHAPRLPSALAQLAREMARRA